jgi:hypothetical protein
MNSDHWQELWREQPPPQEPSAELLFKRVTEDVAAFDRRLREGDRKTLWLCLVFAMMTFARWLLSPSDFDGWADWTELAVLAINAAIVMTTLAAAYFRGRRDLRYDQSLLGAVERGIDVARRRLTHMRMALLIVGPLAAILYACIAWRSWIEMPDQRPLFVYMNLCFLALATGGTWSGYRNGRDLFETRIREFTELREKILGENPTP